MGRTIHCGGGLGCWGRGGPEGKASSELLVGAEEGTHRVGL